MNLSDDLTPTADPAPLLRSLRRRRRVRLATRAGLTCAVAMTVAAGLWPRPASRPLVATVASGTSAAPAAPPPPVTMTREELLDSLKDETYAFIRWPDGREQLLIRR